MIPAQAESVIAAAVLGSLNNSIQEKKESERGNSEASGVKRSLTAVISRPRESSVAHPAEDTGSRVELVQMLQKQGYDDMDPEYGRQLLHKLVSDRASEPLFRLMMHTLSGGRYLAEEVNGTTLLIKAIRNGSLWLIEELMSLGR